MTTPDRYTADDHAAAYLLGYNAARNADHQAAGRAETTTATTETVARELYRVTFMHIDGATAVAKALAHKFHITERHP